jgi:hypothetical protein
MGRRRRRVLTEENAKGSNNLPRTSAQVQGPHDRCGPLCVGRRSLGFAPSSNRRLGGPRWVANSTASTSTSMKRAAATRRSRTRATRTICTKVICTACTVDTSTSTGSRPIKSTHHPVRRPTSVARTEATTSMDRAAVMKRYRTAITATSWCRVISTIRMDNTATITDRSRSRDARARRSGEVAVAPPHRRQTVTNGRPGVPYGRPTCVWRHYLPL